MNDLANESREHPLHRHWDTPWPRCDARRVATSVRPRAWVGAAPTGTVVHETKRRLADVRPDQRVPSQAAPAYETHWTDLLTGRLPFIHLVAHHIRTVALPRPRFALHRADRVKTTRPNVRKMSAVAPTAQQPEEPNAMAATSRRRVGYLRMITRPRCKRALS
jgi:hypothetical protein